MPTYRALGITAELQVASLQQSLPTSILAQHSDQQRQEMKRIETLFQNATILPEQPLLDRSGDRSSIVRHVGQRGVLAPLLICEAGQHFSMVKTDARPCIGREEKTLEIMVSSNTGSFNEPFSAPQHSEHDHAQSHDTHGPARRKSRQQHGVKKRAAELRKADVRHKFKSTSLHEGQPQALCIAIDLTDKTYVAGKSGGRTKHNASDFQVEVFVNGDLAGSCYVNRKLGAVSAVEMVRGRLVFRGRRIHRQIEAVWVYIPRSTRTSKDQQAASKGEEDVKQWIAVSELLAAEADSRGWDQKLGLAPPSADFLRGLSSLPVPEDLSKEGGLGIIDIIVTAGDGKKASQAMGHIQEPTWMTNAQYSADNKQIVPSSKLSSTVIVDTATATDDGHADAEKSSTRVTPLATTAIRKNAAMCTRDTNIVDFASFAPERNSESGDFDHAYMTEGDNVKITPDASLTTSFDQPDIPANPKVLESPTRKRRKLSMSPHQNFTSGEKNDYWDLIAEFDLSSLNSSKIDLAQQLTIGVTRGDKLSKRPLSRCLSNLKQMSSANREKQVNAIEKSLGQSLLKMMREAARESGEVESIEQGNPEVQEPSSMSSRDTSPNENDMFSVSLGSVAEDDTRRAETLMAHRGVGHSMPVVKSALGEIVPTTTPPGSVPTTSLQLTAENYLLAIAAPADSNSLGKSAGMDDLQLVQTRASMALDRDAPSGDHLLRKCLPWTQLDMPMDVVTQIPDAAKSTTFASTPKASVVNPRGESPVNLVYKETAFHSGCPSAMTTAAGTKNHSLDRSPHDELDYHQTSIQVTHQRRRCREKGLVRTNSPPRLTIEQQFQAISAGIYHATSSTSRRPVGNVWSGVTPPRSEPRGPSTKMNSRDKIQGNPFSPAPNPIPASGEQVPQFVEAMKKFEAPKLNEGSSVGYGEPPHGFRHTGKARRGEFREQEVVIGFRFCVY